MWVDMKGTRVYYQGYTVISKCFSKKFVIQAMKAHIFPANFSKKTHLDLLKKADIKAKEDYLDSAENIAKMVRKLVKLNLVNYIQEFQTKTS